MKNTAIEIIDTQDSSHITQDKYAKAKSIRLGWEGGDYKDELFVVGSYLKFTLISLDCSDGVYYDLFTGDETRFKVIWRDLDTNEIYWQGFLLPDSYSEPYKVGPIDVSFTATDGLGRLKGKYLSNDFYAEEKSVIEILSGCLSQTGLDLNFRFAPAIENTSQRDYNQIYINTRDYLDGDKKRDCYDILQELFTQESGQNVIYQADNYFNLEGINVREFRVYKTKEYTITGDFVQELEVTRNIKEVTPIATPNITMQAPYGVINVSHEKKVVEFPDTLVQEENDGWVLYNAGEYSVFALDWEGFNNFSAYATEYIENDYTQFPDNRKDLEVYWGKGNPTQYINLKEKPYIRKYGKYELNLDFKIITESDLNEVTRETVFDAGFWENPFNMRIYLQYQENGVDKEETLFANFGVDENGYQYAAQDFDVDGEKENRLRFAANHSGILNIELYAVEDIENNYIFGISLSEAEIKHLNFEPTYIASKELSGYTSKKDIELSYADDATAKSKSYRLQKLREIETTYNLDYYTNRTYDKDGFTYDVVDLGVARIVKDNISPAEPVEVIYNYLNTEDHIIRYPVGYTLPVISYFGFTDVIENRDYWEQWTDSMYKIEKIPYPEVVANIYNRMFDKPVPKVDFTVKNNIKFNDFIKFTYRSKNQFILTNCELDIDNELSDVTCIQTYYAVEAGTNIPPVVEAGNDIAIGDGVTQAELTSEGFDPDGFIVSYRWEVIEGSGVSFTNPNEQNTTVTGLTGDKYVFEVTVTDNDGATATDTVTVFRDQTHVISLEVVSTSATATKYRVTVTPEIANGAAINFRGQYRVFRQSSSGSGNAQVNRFKNGTQLSTLPQPYPTPPNTYSFAQDLVMSYEPGDVIEFELIAVASSPDIAEAHITIDTAELVSGIGEVNGTPLNESQVAP